MLNNTIDKFMISYDPISNHSGIADYPSSIGDPMSSSNFNNISKDRYNTADYLYSGTNGTIGILITQAVSRELNILILENIYSENDDSFGIKIRGSNTNSYATAVVVLDKANSSFLKDEHNCYFIKYDTASYKYFWLELTGFTGDAHIGMIWWDIFYEFERNPINFKEKIIDRIIYSNTGTGIIYKTRLLKKTGLNFTLNSINGTFLTKMKEIFNTAGNYNNYWLLYNDENDIIVFKKLSLKSNLEWDNIVKNDFSISLEFEESLI